MIWQYACQMAPDILVRFPLSRVIKGRKEAISTPGHGFDEPGVVGIIN
jgi:hypothetical protein